MSFGITKNQGTTEQNVGYTSYVANLTQTGTNAPSVTVLFNNTGFTPMWGYIGVGIYSCTAVGMFTSGAWVIINPSSSEGILNTAVIDSDDTVTVYVMDLRDALGSLINDALIATAFEIRKY